MTKSCVFTHCDLDGATVYLVLKWFYPNTDFEVNVVRSAFNFREQFLSWCVTHKLTDYETVFILDLDIGGNEDLVDKENVFIVDHHETHTKIKYNKAKAFVKKYSSACKLLYKILSTRFPHVKITENQKMLIALTDDYDSYTLKSPLSKPLNTLYWNLTDSFNTFCKQFAKGFTRFTSEQVSILKIHAVNYNKYKSNIKEIYSGEIQWKDKTYTVCSFFADKHINDLADDFFKLKSTDVIIIANLESKKLYIRRNRNVDQDLHIGELCEKWGGGGHEGAGGCPLTEDFLALSKTFKMEPI